MNLKGKDVCIIALSLCFAISSGLNLVFALQLGTFEVTPSELEVLVIGTGSGPNDLDPTECWDKDSQIVIEQVVETLFIYDTRQYIIGETMPRINWLATGYSWDVTNTTLTVDIRTGVYFHDGTLMDANAVAWSFNRLLYLINHTGELPPDARVVKVHSLYEFTYFFYGSLYDTPIFDSVVATDVDTVVFTLTAPYAPILDLMCHISSGILSPHSTPATSIIDLTGDIVGTGPYMYDYYITDTEVRFIAFEDYWGGIPAGGGTPVAAPVMFDAMVYSIIDNPSALNYAMLTGDINVLFDPLDDLIPTFRTNPWINVYEADKAGLVYQYLAFNTHQINVTWRKAMSYAINYTYIIEEMLEGHAFRAYGAISPSFGNSFNHWLRDAPQTAIGNGSAVYDLQIARQVILDGLGGDARLAGLTANSNPNDPAWEATDFVLFNYTYDIYNSFSSALYPLLEDWFDDIGITVEDGGIDWAWYWWRFYWYGNIPGGYDQFQIYFKQQGSDYLDPFNILEPLFSNVSVSNTCQVNDPWVQGNLSLALQTTDDNTRDQIYWDLQWRLFAELYVHAPVYHNMVTTVHTADIYDMGYNVMGRWWALPVKRNLTWVPEI
ncbi:MAG: ABC transporter substrate-binding protein [Promethearchaeota archaeon]